MSKITQVTDANFNAEVLGAGPAMVDFWGAHCRACDSLAPVLEQIAGEFEGKVRVFGLDVGGNIETASAYGIFALPSLVFFRDGKEVSRIAGAAPRARILAEIEKLSRH